MSSSILRVGREAHEPNLSRALLLFARRRLFSGKQRKQNTGAFHGLHYRSGTWRYGDVRPSPRSYSCRGSVFAQRTSAWQLPSGNTVERGPSRSWNFFVREFTSNTFGYIPVFYPIGNSPASFLLECLPPEQDANVLLLGCGDPRSILFTAYNVQDDKLRNVDFTCCDMQPAILARNILLLSLILDDRDGKNSSKYWRIFYHFLIDNDSFSTIRDQARKLMGLATTVDTWHESTYGPILRMVSQDTLCEIRSFWKKYFEATGSDQHQASVTKFHDSWRRIREAPMDRLNVSGVRAVGPLAPVIGVALTSEHLNRFWRTGVAGGNAADEFTAKILNPMFIYTSFGDEFAVSTSQDPFLGYHLELAHTEVLKSGPFGEALRQKSRATTRQKLLDYAAQVAKAQFKEWSNAFHKMASRKNIVVRFHLGDALRFCRALEVCREKGPDAASFEYAQSWRTAPLKLDGGDYKASSPSPAPTAFDVIETSNLADFVGLLNILIAANLVLSTKPASTLYTQTFRGKQKAHSVELFEMLGGDVVTMSLLLGIAPTGYMTATAPNSSAQEYIHLSSNNIDVRISWKQPMLGDETALDYSGSWSVPVCAFPPEELAMVLLQIYHTMFQHERVSCLKDSACDYFRFWYTRETYVEFLRLVKRRVDTDWPRSMETLLENIFHGKYSEMSISRSGFCDLLLHLHQSGVYIGAKRKFSLVAYPIPSSSFQPGILPGPDVPEGVTIVLTVPRSNMEGDYLGAKATICAGLTCPLLTYMTSSVQTVFGRLIHSEDELRGTIEEDNAENLVVSFSAPRNLLFNNPDSIDVVFSFVPTIFNRPVKGREHLFPSPEAWVIYKSTLINKSEVAVFREPPGISCRRPVIEGPRLPPVSADLKRRIPNILAYFDQEAKVEKFKVRLDYDSGTIESKQLWYHTPTVIQHSPCTVDIIIPKCNPRNLAFPYPVDASQAEIRVLGILFSKSIEISIPPSRPTDESGFNSRILQTMNTKPPIVWNMPRVKLDRLPILDTESYQDMRWLPIHLSCMYSDRERQIHNDKEASTKGNLKISLSSIFLNASGTLQQGQKNRVFGISSPSHSGTQVLIFVSNIRLDFGSRTVVADARVLPLTEKIISSEKQALETLDKKSIFPLSVGDPELECWKEILPAFVERCRNWEHTASCEYPEHGIPVSTAARVSPLCSCGVGRAPQTVLEVEEWKPFERYWTRAAIAPIFAFPYAESCDMPIEGLEAFKGALEAPRISNVDRRTTEVDRRTTEADKRTTEVDRRPPLTPIKNAKTQKVHRGMTEADRKSATELPVISGVCQKCRRKPDTGTKVACKRCKKVSYCSVACMKADWGRHKSLCKK